MKHRINLLYIIEIILLLGIGILIYFLVKDDNSAVNIDAILSQNNFSAIDEDKAINWDKLDSSNITLSN